MFLTLLLTSSDSDPRRVFKSELGYTFIQPVWIPEEMSVEVGRTIDQYVQMYEGLSKDKITTYGLLIDIVNAPQIKDGELIYDGLFTGQALSRKIQIVWRRNDSGYPATRNPMPAFLHELIHDTQFRARISCHHNFTNEEIIYANTDKYSRYVDFAPGR